MTAICSTSNISTLFLISIWSSCRPSSTPWHHSGAYNHRDNLPTTTIKFHFLAFKHLSKSLIDACSIIYLSLLARKKVLNVRPLACSPSSVRLISYCPLLLLKFKIILTILWNCGWRNQLARRRIYNDLLSSFTQVKSYPKRDACTYSTENLIKTGPHFHRGRRKRTKFSPNFCRISLFIFRITIRSHFVYRACLPPKVKAEDNTKWKCIYRLPLNTVDVSSTKTSKTPESEVSINRWHPLTWPANWGISDFIKRADESRMRERKGNTF